MDALTALRAIVADDAKWARPKSWAGYKVAIAYVPPSLWNSSADWKLVPSPRGGSTAYLPRPLELLGEWEVIEPREVNEGR